MGSSKGGQTIGFHYILSLWSGLCLAPIDELVEIEADEKQAWVGPATDATPQKINKPDLFGGEKKEGGLQGAFMLMQGAADQVLPDATLVTGIGGTGPVTSTTIPNFKTLIGGLVSEARGFVSVLYDGLVCSMSPYPKEWKYRIRKHNAHSAWYPAKARIVLHGDGGYTDSSRDYKTDIHAMNPAHIFYKVMTDKKMGRGLSPDTLDENALIYAANTLCNEGLGLCLFWSRTDDIDRFLQVVCDHVNGLIYTDPETGKIVFRLIRDDYDPADVPLYDATSGLLDITADDSASSEEAINGIIVQGVDPVNHKDFQVKALSLGGYHAKGEANVDPRDYKGIPTRGLALRIAQRDLRMTRAGLKRFQVTLDRRAWRVTPGSVIRISAPNREISDIVLRVGKVDRGTTREGAIKCWCVEDAFSMPASSFAAVPTSTWTPLTTVTAPASATKLTEAGWRDLLLKMGATNAATVDPTSAAIGQLAAAPSGGTYLGYDLASEAAGDADYTIKVDAGWFTGTATLSTALGALDTDANLSSIVELSADNEGQALLIAATDGSTFEIVNLVSFGDGTPITIARGCADTVPQDHPIGARIWTIDDDVTSDGREYASGETVTTKVLTRTAQAVLDIADATPESIDLVARHHKPYPPGDLQVGGVSVYSLTDTYAEPDLTWVHRDRLLEADQLVPHGDPGIGPEAGTTYNVRVYDFDGTTLLNTYTGITGTSWTYTGTMQSADGAGGAVWLELESERDSLTSWQFYRFLVPLESARITETSELRITEDGSIRIKEI